MKRIIALFLLITCFALITSAEIVEIRDSGTQITYNHVVVSPNTITTLNLDVNYAYYTALFNVGDSTPWIGSDRNVSPNTKGKPLYPSCNATYSGRALLFAVCNQRATINVEHEWE